MHLICTAARNEDVFLAYRVTIPRQHFNFKNAMPQFIQLLIILPLNLTVSSWGITAFVPAFSAFSTIASES